MMKGLGVSQGIAIGKVYLLERKITGLTNIPIGESEIIKEIKKLDKALQSSIKDIEDMKRRSIDILTREEVDILESHIELLGDPMLYKNIKDKIEKDKKNSSDAVIEAIENTKQFFLNMENEYFSGRAADIEDIGNRILSNLSSESKEDISKLNEDVIVCAFDLTPSETISMDKRHVLAFVTEQGGRTSHTAIIANIKGIPAVVGFHDFKKIKNGKMIIVDGISGEVFIEPDDDTINIYKVKQEEFHERQKRLKLIKELPAQTEDGLKVKLVGNISSPADINRMFEYGGEGIGLFRTEFLYMDRTCLPTEEEQFTCYTDAVVRAKGYPVIIRTLDIGGDKKLSYLDLPSEMNPFLGYRAIRICLDRRDIFLTQLRAILRASVFGKLKIMFPMISGIQELREAKIILEQAKRELDIENIQYDGNIEVGVMIEIPSAAITADILAKEVGFFSIGTNDLCQYVLAVDRMNEKVASLYSPFHPGVLRLIKNVIEQAHLHGISVGMCGEMASDPLATLLLLGMGLEEFSVSVSAIPYIKEIIRKNSMPKAKEISSRVMEMESSDKIIEYLQVVLE